MDKREYLTNCVGLFHSAVTNPLIQLDGFQVLDDANKVLVAQRVEASKNEIDRDYIPVNPDELVRVDWVDPLEAPKELLMPLLPYQKEGLGWMVHQETSNMAGGILADEMGMGKTIQTIALLLHQKDAREKLAVAAAKKGRATRREDARAPTLVVVPTSALAQWEDEIRDCVAPGALRVVARRDAAWARPPTSRPGSPSSLRIRCGR